MSQDLIFRPAKDVDLGTIVELLSDDDLGSQRESLDTSSLVLYKIAFDKILADPSQELTLVELEGVIVGCFQLSFIQYLTHRGGLRAQLEGVRVKEGYRKSGVGKQIIQFVKQQAINKGCFLLQLTTDKQRINAIKFYEKLGFVPSHEGMKMKLNNG